MNPFARFRRSRKRSSSGHHDAGTSVYLLVDASGWQVKVGDSGTARSGETPAGGDGPVGRLEASFGLAARHLKTLRSIGTIHIAIDDPDSRYVDLRNPRLASATSQYLHEFGAEQIGREHVACGRVAAEPDGERNSPTGAVGFQDLATLNACLTRLDDLAVKVARVAPLADLMRRHLTATVASQPVCGMHMAGDHTHVMLLHAGYAGFVLRTIPIGYRAITEALRKSSGIDDAEARNLLATRALLADIRETDPAGDNADVRTNANDRALGPLMRQFADSISESLSFFEQQRMSGRPERLSILNMDQPIKGLADFIGGHLGIEAELSPVDFFEILTRGPPEPSMNLLEDVGSDLQIGPVAHRFHHGMIRTVEEITREEAAQAEATDSAAPARAPDSSRGRSSRRRRRRSNDPDGGILARLFSRGRAAGAPGSHPDQDRQVGLLAILVLLAAGYFGYEEIQWRDLQWQGRINALDATIVKNIKLKQDTAAPTKQVTSSGEIDKVLWTEKFLALAENMNETMWLTDVYLEVTKRTIGDSEIEEKKLVIQGAVLPSTDGHILQIAEFINRLEKDRAGFMDDFREILFEGAFLDREEADPVIRFAIEARYDAKKRLNAVRSATNEKTATSIGEVQETTKARNKAQEEALPESIR